MIKNKFFFKILLLFVSLFCIIPQTNAGILQGFIDADINKPQLAFAIKAYHANDYPKMMSLLEPLAEKGYHPAQLFLGAMYANRLGTTSPNKDLAIMWLQKSAAQGNKDAEKILKEIQN